MAYRPAVVAQAGDERAQHGRHMRPHRVGVYLGRQLRYACAGRLPHCVVVCACAARVDFHDLHICNVNQVDILHPSIMHTMS